MKDIFDPVEKCVRFNCLDSPTCFFIHRNIGDGYPNSIRGFCEKHFKENYPYYNGGPGKDYIKGWDLVTRDEAITISVITS
jgi:hypothetical protein